MWVIVFQSHYSRVWGWDWQIIHLFTGIVFQSHYSRWDWQMNETSTGQTYDVLVRRRSLTCPTLPRLQLFTNQTPIKSRELGCRNPPLFLTEAWCDEGVMTRGVVRLHGFTVLDGGVVWCKMG